jgi:hypothetical protein
MAYFFFSFLAAFSLNYFEAPSDSVRIGIVSDSEYCGERELGWRIKIAAESLGWEVFLDEKRGKKLKKTKNIMVMKK